MEFFTYISQNVMCRSWFLQVKSDFIGIRIILNIAGGSTEISYQDYNKTVTIVYWDVLLNKPI